MKKQPLPTQKRALLVNDLSMVGRCSLTVALPVVSAFGTEACALPTAVLSTHTGGFRDYTRRDLSEDIPAVCRQWQSLGLNFDGIYTGYLAGTEQIALIERLISAFPSPLLLVDPVMADDGAFYAGFDGAFLARMRDLCRRADVLLPNLTEACLLAGTPYRPDIGRAEAEDIAHTILAEGSGAVVLKGIRAEGDRIGILAARNGRTHFLSTERVPGFYHGAGDVFASVLFSALLAGDSLFRAAERAADFTCRAVSLTHRSGRDTRYGLMFEPLLGELSPDA